MKVNVTQAAEMLGVKDSTVLSLLKHGILTDLKQRDPKKKKHYANFDSKQISDLRKHRIAQIGKITAKTASRLREAISNGKPVALAPLAAKPEPAPKTDGILTRLDRLEQKLDQLIRMWQ